MHQPNRSRTTDEDRQRRAKVLQLKTLPPIPKTLLRVVEICQDDKAPLSDLEAIIMGDQALSAKILRLANAAYYGACGKVGSLSRGFVTLGFQEVRNICLCSLLMEYFTSNKVDQESQKQLWQHSFATARMARQLAKHRPWMNQEEAYLVGLLHDIGRVVMLIHFHDDYAMIHQLAEDLKIPYYLAEWHYGITHTRIGRWLAIKWHFPVLFQQVLEYHHVPWQCTSFHKETKLIYLANVLAHYRSYPEYATVEPTKFCCKELYIPEEEWLGYCEQMESVWREVDLFWQMLR
jgi:HD-like signal output (HDOD) protein